LNAVFLGLSVRTLKKKINIELREIGSERRRRME
jgi:hypothetical protein